MLLRRCEPIDNAVLVQTCNLSQVTVQRRQLKATPPPVGSHRRSNGCELEHRSFKSRLNSTKRHFSLFRHSPRAKRDLFLQSRPRRLQLPASRHLSLQLQIRPVPTPSARLPAMSSRCTLVADRTDDAVQMLLGFIALSSLYAKWHFERPRRPAKVWFMEAGHVGRHDPRHEHPVRYRPRGLVRHAQRRGPGASCSCRCICCFYGAGEEI
jgi:hypothetical protein